MGDFQLWDKVRVSKGRLKGETGTVIGETNLNMNHRLIVRRANPRARDKIMGFHEDELISNPVNTEVSNVRNS